MERVDVVIVGGGVAGLAAATAAAQGGVRAIVVEQASLPRSMHLLYALHSRDLAAMGLETTAAERVHEKLAFGGDPIALGGAASIHVIRGQTVHHHLYSRARTAGAVIRDGVEAIGAQLDPDGWTVRASSAEPIRAPVLIVADGARSTTLRSIGLAGAHHFSGSDAEIITFLCATWELPPSEIARWSSPQVRESAGPIGRLEILPGRDRLTVAIGPVWAGVSRGDEAWPSAAAQGSIAALERACRTLSLSPKPRAVELEEWRLDALPAPAVFDGLVVIGAAAGHRPRRPLSAQGSLFRAGKLAGAAAAKAVLAGQRSALALGASLGEEYQTIVCEVEAEIAHEAHGLRRVRPSVPFAL